MAINWPEIRELVRIAIKDDLLISHKCGITNDYTSQCYAIAKAENIDQMLEFVENADDRTLLTFVKIYELDFNNFAPKDRERIYRIRIIPHDVYEDGEIYLGETPKWYASNMPALSEGDTALQIYNKNKGYINFEHAFIVVDQFEELLNFDGGNTEVLMCSEEITGATIDQVVLEVAAERALSRRAREMYGIQGEYENKSMPNKV